MFVSQRTQNSHLVLQIARVDVSSSETRCLRTATETSRRSPKPQAAASSTWTVPVRPELSYGMKPQSASSSALKISTHHSDSVQPTMSDAAQAHHQIHLSTAITVRIGCTVPMPSAWTVDTALLARRSGVRCCGLEGRSVRGARLDRVGLLVWRLGEQAGEIVAE
jgi:hypothetical protein